jgi:hypothetical protein
MYSSRISVLRYIASLKFRYLCLRDTAAMSLWMGNTLNLVGVRAEGHCTITIVATDEPNSTSHISSVNPRNIRIMYQKLLYDYQVVLATSSELVCCSVW